ncbi:translationally-controlled tumor protein homolog [Pempheris klunzingeri]|uniref:translationally-controlled tumor protein homolog n=1 Tax=Pempheris klunzingeri TaxID=3127111 RepID=UPI00397FAE84
MIIYKCVISGDEMFADTFKIKESKNGIFYEVEGKRITRLEGFDDSLISANASTEEASEASEENCVSGVDIVLNHKLQETSFNKKAYMSYIKEYVKTIRSNLETNNPERVEEFMSEVQSEIKTILGNLKNYQFFTGETMVPEGMVALMDYREDGVTPYMLFFKDGLVAEKC